MYLRPSSATTKSWTAGTTCVQVCTCAYVCDLGMQAQMHVCYILCVNL